MRPLIRRSHRLCTRIAHEQTAALRLISLKIQYNSPEWACKGRTCQRGKFTCKKRLHPRVNAGSASNHALGAGARRSLRVPEIGTAPAHALVPLHSRVPGFSLELSAAPWGRLSPQWAQLRLHCAGPLASRCRRESRWLSSPAASPQSPGTRREQRARWQYR
jgi:hypothetical protein